MKKSTIITLVICGIVSALILWLVISAENYTLPCSWAKGMFSINGTEAQSYAMRCKW